MEPAPEISATIRWLAWTAALPDPLSVTLAKPADEPLRGKVIGAAHDAGQRLYLAG